MFMCFIYVIIIYSRRQPGAGSGRRQGHAFRRAPRELRMQQKSVKQRLNEKQMRLKHNYLVNKLVAGPDAAEAPYFKLSMTAEHNQSSLRATEAAAGTSAAGPALHRSAGWVASAAV